MGSKTAYIEPSLTKENGYCESFIARFELSKFWLWRVTAPNPHAPIAKVNGAASLKVEARSTRWGLRVEAVDSFEESFVGS